MHSQASRFGKSKCSCFDILNRFFFFFFFFFEHLPIVFTPFPFARKEKRNFNNFLEGGIGRFFLEGQMGKGWSILRGGQGLGFLLIVIINFTYSIILTVLINIQFTCSLKDVASLVIFHLCFQLISFYLEYFGQCFINSLFKRKSVYKLT